MDEGEFGDDDLPFRDDDVDEDDVDEALGDDDDKRDETRRQPNRVSVADTSYITDPTPEKRRDFLKRARELIISRFPKAAMSRIGTIGFRGDTIVVFSRDGLTTHVLDSAGELSTAFVSRFSNALGPTADELLAQLRQTADQLQGEYSAAVAQLNADSARLKLLRDAYGKKFLNEKIFTLTVDLGNVNKNIDRWRKRLGNSKGYSYDPGNPDYPTQLEIYTGEKASLERNIAHFRRILDEMNAKEADSPRLKKKAGLLKAELDRNLAEIAAISARVDDLSPLSGLMSASRSIFGAVKIFVAAPLASAIELVQHFFVAPEIAPDETDAAVPIFDQPGVVYKAYEFVENRFVAPLAKEAQSFFVAPEIAPDEPGVIYEAYEAVENRVVAPLAEEAQSFFVAPEIAPDEADAAAPIFDEPGVVYKAYEFVENRVVAPFAVQAESFFVAPDETDSAVPLFDKPGVFYTAYEFIETRFIALFETLSGISTPGIQGMAEFGYDDPDLDYKLDNDGDDDDKSDQEVDTTRPFQPGAASTPYHGGEQIKMKTMQHEQSGLPDTSYDVEAPLLSDFVNPEEKQGKVNKAIDFIKRRFPKVDLKKLGPIGFSKKGAQSEIVSFGPRGGETQIFKKDGSGFLKSFTDKFSKSLGPSAEEIIAEDRDTIKEQRQRILETEKQEKEAEKIAAENQKEKLEIERLKTRLDVVNARIDSYEMQYGSNLEAQNEIERLKQLKKNYETDLKQKEKKIADLKKIEKNREKAQKKVNLEREKLVKKEKERNLIEERLNSTKPLDDLNEQESGLKRQNEEDQAIIQDENASPSERQAAEERVAERNEELDRLQSQIEERERAMPLRERVKEIFKKYGVTVTAIFLAAGVTIGAVISTITNALKSMGQQMANGLKTVGAKAASALPGLIGAIVSFLFKTAGQAIGFLAEHTWLLILAVVAFIFEKYIKRRR